MAFRRMSSITFFDWESQPPSKLTIKPNRDSFRSFRQRRSMATKSSISLRPRA